LKDLEPAPNEEQIRELIGASMMAALLKLDREIRQIVAEAVPTPEDDCPEDRPG
jgi:hypothetical protein